MPLSLVISFFCNIWLDCSDIYVFACRHTSIDIRAWILLVQWSAGGLMDWIWLSARVLSVHAQSGALGTKATVKFGFSERKVLCLFLLKRKVERVSCRF